MESSDWFQGGALTVVCGLLVWLLTRAGPDLMKRHRQDIKDIQKECKEERIEMLDKFKDEMREERNTRIKEIGEVMDRYNGKEAKPENS